MDVLAPGLAGGLRGELVVMRLLRTLVFAPVAAAFAMSLASLQAGNPPVSADAMPPAAASAQIDALVRELGSDKFAAREAASRELVRLGMVTQPALERASQSPDAEVRLRARSVLATVIESDFQQRLEAFAADYDGAKSQSLPAWEQFSTQFGNSRLARQLFVEMQRAEPDLLEALAESPAAASDALNDRMRQIIDGRRESLMQLGTLASLLFVGAADDVRVGDDGCLHIYPFVVQSTYHRNNKSPLWPGILKKMVGRWIAKDTTPSMTNQNLTLAAQLEMKDEALSIASRVLAEKESAMSSRQISILMIGRFGGHEDLERIEHLLKDTTSCGMVQVENPPRQVEMQIRDVALAAMLQMTGQNLREYGYHSVQEFGPTVYQLGTLGFSDAEARDAALKKWASWRAERPAG